MATLTIRAIDDTLVRRLKSEAALSGRTLKALVVEKLEATNWMQAGKGESIDRSTDATRVGRVSHPERGGSAPRGVPASRRCMCMDREDQHANGGVCRVPGCKCRKFEEG